MSASTEAILIDLIFGLGALIVIAGLIGLLFLVAINAHCGQ
ncbi:hypothetical protein N627_0982 [Levilactobacillus brevis]|nr:hypothetical protein N627_0982 [Levilactobacillus brevis]